MKKIFFPALVFIFIATQAQTFKFPVKPEFASVGIPGTRIMIDQGETSVSDWMAFIYNQYFNSQGYETQPGYELMLPDTNVLPEKYRFMFRILLRLSNTEDIGKDNKHPYLYSYYGTITHKKFYLPLLKSEERGALGRNLNLMLELPIVAVNYDQVLEYLKWREEYTNNDISVQKTGSVVKLRLMSRDEWNQYADKLGPHTYDNHSVHIDTVNQEGCYLLNVKVDKPCSSVLEGIKMYGPGAVRVIAYNADQLGLYSMFGNVWEMSQEKGIAMGGSYHDYAIECEVSKFHKYSGPEPWLGFRSVLEFY